MDLATKLSYITGIGPTLASRLETLGIKTVEDLINHFPFRYDDFSQTSSVSNAQIGSTATIYGEVWSIKNVYTRSKKVLTSALINDGSGTLEVVWFNQPWLTRSIKAGDKLQLSGKVNRKGTKISLAAPVWEKLPSLVNPGQQQSLHTGRLVPIYPETYGLTSKWIRSKISQILPAILPQITDGLPEIIKGGMLPLNQALEKIHFPKDYQDIEAAQKRLGFDELFYIQLATQKKRLEWQTKTIGKKINVTLDDVENFYKKLPFKLTSAQIKVTNDILADLQQIYPMNRLLQGEVGSGKTVVAAIASYTVCLNNLRTIVMAPTEILAFQHYQTFKQLLGPLGINIGIYTGSKKYTTNNPEIPDIVIGTHALLTDKLPWESTGLVVIDEQQRFGVAQRTKMRNLAKIPHFLTMTATPIPRTVALTIYGDLDLSVIDEMPTGRKIVKTYHVPAKKRNDSYKFISKLIGQGDQAYIITPLIDQSESLLSAKAAKVEYERLRKKVFPKNKLGLLHGKLKPKEKQQAITDFKDHKIDILVSTSVVEVGVDIPNATVMVIEGSERFGLAQLHQLRGRVGRGDKQSYALLFTESSEPNIVRRVKNLESIHDGLKLAELDLKIRGSGQIFGTAQSGRWNLKIASLTDLALIEKARMAASYILTDSPKLDKYLSITSKLSHLASDVMPD